MSHATNSKAAAILITALGGLNPHVSYSSDVDRGTIQDMFDYASEFSRNDDSLRAIIVYDLMLRAFSRTKKTQNLLAVCENLAANVRPDDVNHFNLSFWNCPEDVLINWLGNIDRFRSIEPIRIHGAYPRYPTQTEVPEGSVTLSFDISETGDVENIKVIESSIAIWEASAIAAVEKWKYSPARFNGKPVAKSDVKQKFTFRFE